MRDRKDLANSDKPLFFDRFANKNDFSAALYEGGITGMAQDDDKEDDDNDNDNNNTIEYP